MYTHIHIKERKNTKMFTSKKGEYSNKGITGDFYIIFSVLYFSIFLK